jgi:hypothetical protein
MTFVPRRAWLTTSDVEVDRLCMSSAGLMTTAARGGDDLSPGARVSKGAATIRKSTANLGMA